MYSARAQQVLRSTSSLLRRPSQRTSRLLGNLPPRYSVACVFPDRKEERRLNCSAVSIGTGIGPGIGVGIGNNPYILGSNRRWSENGCAVRLATRGLASSSTAASTAAEDALASLETAATEASNASNASNASEAVQALAFEPSWYNPSDQVISLVLSVHESTGMPYVYSVVAMTAVLRLVLMPVMINGQRNSSRMAHMKPEMDALKARFDSAGPTLDPQAQAKFASHMQALFQKYDCHPIKAMVAPFLQIPIFMSMFFGLRKMPDYFPQELASGGDFWFTDLTAPDPYYALPILCGASFIGMIELNKQTTLSSPGGQNMVHFFRFMGLVVIPITAYLPTILFAYWVPSNLISLFQVALLQQPKVRSHLGIWDPPKPVPGAPPQKGLVEQLQDAMGQTQKNASGVTPGQSPNEEAMAERNRKIDLEKQEKQRLRQLLAEVEEEEQEKRRLEEGGGGEDAAKKARRLRKSAGRQAARKRVGPRRR